MEPPKHASSFIDTSTECAICLQPFDDNAAAEPSLTLTCGHRWHMQCLRHQLQVAQPTPSRRLLFTGCRCAKCGAVCEHPELEDVTRTTDVLRQRVDELIVAQWKIDHPVSREQNNLTTKEILEEGRRKYAFYMCGSCGEPFFGGTVECAEAAGDEVAIADRHCPDCAPQQVECRSPQSHRGAHIWKCRYCCQPAVFVCYGNVHFCKDCHDRNTERVRRQPVGTRERPQLDPIPCQGASCTAYPKLVGETSHRNGPTSDCEQVYGCAICSGSTSNAPILPSGSHNLLLNPSGAQGLSHWTRVRGDWQVERSELQLRGTTSTNFVSTYVWCVMVQRVSLLRYRGPLRIEISAYVMGRTDCPSVYQLSARIDQQSVQRAQGRTSADAWERVSFVLDAPIGARMVEVYVAGKDERFWRGLFGAKMCEVSVRVLGSAEELEQAGVLVDPGTG